MKKTKNIIFLVIAICMLLSSGILASAQEMARNTIENGYNSQWYADSSSYNPSGWGTRTGNAEKENASSMWICSTSGPDCNVFALGYDGSQYHDCSRDRRYVYYLPSGTSTNMENLVNESRYQIAAVDLDLRDVNQRYTRIIGNWKADIE